MSRITLCFAGLILSVAVSRGAEQENLIPNPGFDDPAKSGWFARGKTITLDPVGAYGTSCLRVVTPENEKYPGFYFVRTLDLPALPNRTYTFQCLVKTAHTAGTARAGVRLVNAAGTSVGYKMAEEIEPGQRDWHQQKVTFTTHEAVATMQIYLIHRDMKGTVWYDECELRPRPPKLVPPIGDGAAVTFDGGPGALDMRVEEVEQRDGKILVQTTGAEYLVDPKAGSILGSQRIEVQRPMVEIAFPKGLDGLRVIRHDDEVCVLSTGKLDIGIQCDSLIVVAAAEEQPVVCEGKIGGVWARCEEGHVLAIDDRGGVGIYPHAMQGSGKKVEVPQTPADLSKPGWTSTHTIGSSSRLGISVFPPRKFDWEKSFKWRLCHTGGAFPPDQVLDRWSEYASHMCLHASAMWASDHPWVGPYEQKDPDGFRQVIATCKQNGMTVIPYMSPWYFHIRDADAFIEQLAAQKAEFGFGGIYYDGLWYDDWIESYRVMRMTRELFPQGCVYLHSTVGPPIFSRTMWCPFLDTYADFVLRGEGHVAHGPDAPYVRYVAAGYRTSNAIGMMKGDKWDVDAKTQKQVMFGYHGRGRWGTYPRHDKDGNYVFPGQESPLTGFWTDWYFPELERLEQEWQKGRPKP